MKTRLMLLVAFAIVIVGCGPKVQPKDPHREALIEKLVLLEARVKIERDIEATRSLITEIAAAAAMCPESYDEPVSWLVSSIDDITKCRQMRIDAVNAGRGDPMNPNGGERYKKFYKATESIWHILGERTRIFRSIVIDAQNGLKTVPGGSGSSV
jgi:hypothetical protein